MWVECCALCICFATTFVSYMMSADIWRCQTNPWKFVYIPSQTKHAKLLKILVSSKNLGKCKYDIYMLDITWFHKYFESDFSPFHRKWFLFTFLVNLFTFWTFLTIFYFYLKKIRIFNVEFWVFLKIRILSCYQKFRQIEILRSTTLLGM